VVFRRQANSEGVGSAPYVSQCRFSHSVDFRPAAAIGFKQCCRDAGVCNFGGLTMLGQNFTASGSGGLGQNQADLTISLTFKGLSGQVLASQSFTLSGSGAPQNYFTSVAGVHEVDISTGGRGTQLQSFEVMPVPEPETYAMLLAGLGLVGAIARRRATARAA